LPTPLKPERYFKQSQGSEKADIQSKIPHHTISIGNLSRRFWGILLDKKQYFSF
jgi:hypothetical protein